MRIPILLLLAAAPIAAQSLPPFSCYYDVPYARQVRAEGKTELVGDVVITCTGGVPTPAGRAIPTANFTLSFDSTVTSRILGAGNASEALLLLDNPPTDAQYPCTTSTCANTGNGTGAGYYGPQGNFNVYQGALGASSGARTITWSNVPVDPPGAAVPRTFRFTNIRMDATAAAAGQLHLTGISVTGAAAFTPIPNVPAFARAAGIPRPMISAGSMTVANAVPSLTTVVLDSAGASPAPAGVPVNLAVAGSSTAARVATLQFSTSQAGVTVPRTIAQFVSPDVSPAPADQNYPGGFYRSESGFYNSAFPTATSGGNLSLAGLADSGTRLMATFTNIPPGVTVYVALVNDSAGSYSVARLVATDANGAGAFAPVPGNGTIAQLATVNGAATAVWEVMDSNAEIPDSFNFGVYFSYAPGIYGPLAPAGVVMRYAPLGGAIPTFAGPVSTLPLATFTAAAQPLPTPPVLSVSPGSMTFTATAGGNNPPAQSLFVASSPSGIGFAISGAGSLPIRVQPSGGSTPASVSIQLITLGTSPGTYNDTLMVSGPGSSVQVPITVTIAPAPVVTGISPSSTLAGSPAFTLTVTGANFVKGSTVTWNGAGLATTFGSATQLTAQVPAALVAAAGTATVAVATADGVKSNGVAFTILPFSLTAINPSAIAAGGPAFTLTATGVGFQAGAILNVAGAAAQQISAGATSISATVPASAIAQPGALTVTVTNPGGITSNALTLTVAPGLTLTAINPSTVTATRPAFTLTLTGTGFGAGASAQVGGATLAASSSSSGSITVTVPADAVAQPGSLPVRVVGASGLASNSLTLTVNPPPHLTAISPATGAAGSPGLTLTVTGTGLFAGSTVQWNGQALATSGSGPAQLTAQVPASLLAAAGSASVSVVTADGVSSNSLPFTIGPAATITSLSPAAANVGSAGFTLTVNGANLQQGSAVQWNGQPLATTFGSATQLTAQVPASLLTAATTAAITVSGATGSLPFRVVLPPLTNVSFGAPPNAPSGQDQPVTLALGGTYPVDLKVTVTLTFAPDSGLPDDPAIQFQNGARTFTFTIPAGAPATVPALLFKTGTVAGVITISAAFTEAGGTDVTPSSVAPQRIQVGRAAPTISSVTCSRNAGGFTVVIDGYTNTREATQATFDFTAASGQTLGTTELQVTTTSLFSGWFGSSAAANVGGVFRYTQPFTVNGTATISGVTVKLGNSAGTSATASCQLQ